jgi:uncharacterized protein (DUF1015 family)
VADVKPFKATYYNSGKVRLKDIIMPPYDIIKDKEMPKYYKKSPYNVIRIDKGIAQKSDGKRSNKYTRAAFFLKKWVSEGVLVDSSSPAYYAYTQEYYVPGGAKKTMTGFFAAVRLEEFHKKIVLPHEKTHAGPKKDRLELMRHTHANTSPILSLYFDPKKEIHKILGRAMKQQPLFTIKDEAGINYKICAIPRGAEAEYIDKKFAKKQLFIADGHHRYDTAINFRNEMRAKLGKKKAAGFERILMCLMSMEHSGSIILPTHRILKKFNHDIPGNPVIRRFFTVKKIASTSKLKKIMFAGPSKKDIGFISGKQAYLLSLKEAAYKKAVDKKKHVMDYYMLSVSILHGLVFEKALGLTYEALLPEIIYTQDMDEAINAPKEQGAAAVFLLKPTSIDEVRRISENDEVMPQKSTYFLPKLATGLIINRLADIG